MFISIVIERYADDLVQHHYGPWMDVCVRDLNAIEVRVGWQVYVASHQTPIFLISRRMFELHLRILRREVHNALSGQFRCIGDGSLY